VNTRNELKTEEWIDLFDELRARGVRSVFATGGEIFVRQDIWELLEAMEQRFVVHILTNGHKLSSELTENQVRIVRRLASVQVSVDSATPDLHDRFRGTGSWEWAVSALRRVGEWGVEPIISSVVSLESNVEQLRALANLADELGAKLLLRPLLAQGRGKRIPYGRINMGQIYAALGIASYSRGFLAYSEELLPFGVSVEDVQDCGVLAVGAYGEHLRLLDMKAKRELARSA